MSSKIYSSYEQDSIAVYNLIMDCQHTRHDAIFKTMFKSNDLQTVRRMYRVDTSQISFLKFILEAYDGMAQLTTLNPGLGLVEVYVASGCIKDFEKIIMDLKKQMLIELIGYAEENSAYP